MTVQATQSYVLADGNGVTQTFFFSFPATGTQDVFGFIGGQNQGNVSALLNEDQSNNPGGSLTFNDGPPAAGAQVAIVRKTTADQLTEYPESGRFPAAAHETALDKLTMLVQDNGLKLSSQSLRVPEGELLIEPIPSKAGRANLFLAFDSEGNPVATAPVKGDDGFDPYISDGADGNTLGNWVDADGDTGVAAQGDQGDQGEDGDATQADIDSSVAAHAAVGGDEVLGHVRIVVTGSSMQIFTTEA